MGLLSEYMLAKNLGLHPFDPSRDKPRDVGLGGPSTEYLSTSEDNLGLAFNHPQIWWDNHGNPHMMSGDAGREMALQYERAMSLLFPRFDNIGQAEWFAMNRSANGGGLSGLLAK